MTAEQILKDTLLKYAEKEDNFEATWQSIFVDKKTNKPEELMFRDILQAMKYFAKQEAELSWDAAIEYAELCEKYPGDAHLFKDKTPDKEEYLKKYNV